MCGLIISIHTAKVVEHAGHGFGSSLKGEAHTGDKSGRPVRVTSQGDEKVWLTGSWCIQSPAVA